MRHLNTLMAINYWCREKKIIQPEVINIFNESAVMTVNASVNGPRQGMEAFDPFTETPVEGVNWEFGSSFGQPQGFDDYQLPRTFRVSFGLRF